MRPVCPWATKLIFLLLFPLLFATDEIHGDSTRTDEQEITNSGNAFSTFSLLLVTEDVPQSTGRSGNDHIVFKDGVVNSMWIEPSSSSPTNETARQEMYHDDQYADRVSFDFFYGKFETYDIVIPSCSSSDSSVAKPKIVEFQNEPQDQSGSFSVVYDCQRNPDATLVRDATISVVFPIASGLSVLFQFRKTCGGGDHKYIQFGYYEESENDAKEMSRLPFSSNATAFTVGPHVMSTKLYLHLSPPARTQEFFHVGVKSSDPKLDVTPKGPVFGGVLTTAESSIIHVLYECRGRGRYQVVANIPINPFNTLHASWIKDCGGGYATGFSVGSDLWIKDDVVKHGITSETWALGLHATSSSLSREAPVVNDSVRRKDFWLSNEGFAIDVAPAVVTVEKPTVLAVIAPDAYTRRSIYPTESNGIIPRGEKLRCQLTMICKKKGKSMVVVTFPIKSFTNVDISFQKECRAPRRYVQSGFLRTANTANMMLVSLFLIFLLAYYGRHQWKRSDVTMMDKPAPGYRQV